MIDKELGPIIILLLFVIIIMLGAVINEKNTEIAVLKAKCVKIGVATMTYDINTGVGKFVFEVENNADSEKH